MRSKSQVSVDLNGMSLCIWCMEADLRRGDSEARCEEKSTDSEPLPCFLSLPIGKKINIFCHHLSEGPKPQSP
jgi:hypothetical protein